MSPYIYINERSSTNVSNGWDDTFYSFESKHCINLDLLKKSPQIIVNNNNNNNNDINSQVNDKNIFGQKCCSELIRAKAVSDNLTGKHESPSIEQDLSLRKLDMTKKRKSLLYQSINAKHFSFIKNSSNLSASDTYSSSKDCSTVKNNSLPHLHKPKSLKLASMGNKTHKSSSPLIQRVSKEEETSEITKQNLSTTATKKLSKPSKIGSDSSNNGTWGACLGNKYKYICGTSVPLSPLSPAYDYSNLTSEERKFLTDLVDTTKKLQAIGEEIEENNNNKGFSFCRPRTQSGADQIVQSSFRSSSMKIFNRRTKSAERGEKVKKNTNSRNSNITNDGKRDVSDICTECGFEVNYDRVSIKGNVIHRECFKCSR